MSRTVRKSTPAMPPAALLVITAQDVAAPAPLLRPDDRGVRIRSADLRGVVEHSCFHFIHRGTHRMNVAMRGMPDTRLVVENVVARLRARGGAPAIHDRLHPLTLDAGV